MENHTINCMVHSHVMSQRHNDWPRLRTQRKQCRVVGHLLYMHHATLHRPRRGYWHRWSVCRLPDVLPHFARSF